jgi:hypothetical protein
MPEDIQSFQYIFSFTSILSIVDAAIRGYTLYPSHIQPLCHSNRCAANEKHFSYLWLPNFNRELSACLLFSW